MTQLWIVLRGSEIVGVFDSEEEAGFVCHALNEGMGEGFEWKALPPVGEIAEEFVDAVGGVAG